MKKVCKECGHRCHCYGAGYYLNTLDCESCDCNNCFHNTIKPLIPTEEKMNWIKKQWKKFIDWVFKDFY